jgi:hypothetical protein
MLMRLAPDRPQMRTYWRWRAAKTASSSRRIWISRNCWPSAPLLALALSCFAAATTRIEKCALCWSGCCKPCRWKRCNALSAWWIDTVCASRRCHSADEIKVGRPRRRVSVGVGCQGRPRMGKRISELGLEGWRYGRTSVVESGRGVGRLQRPARAFLRRIFVVGSLYCPFSVSKL